MAVINSRIVIEGHFGTNLMPVKNFAEGGKHRLVFGMAGFGRIRGGHEAAAQAVEIKVLRRGKYGAVKIAVAEECADVVGLDVFVAHGFVVGAVGFEKIFVGSEKGMRIHLTIVPNQHHPAARLENANEFRVGFFTVEPMKRLARGNELDGIGLQRSGFGGAVDAGEAWILCQQAFGGFAHFTVGFDAKDRIAVFEKKLGQDAGAGSDVSDDGIGGQTAFGCEQVDDSTGIAGAVFDVVLDAGGEAFRGVQHCAQSNSLS